ncbi:MAG: HAD-IIA family hydrolase [Pseudomonadota bacterium]
MIGIILAAGIGSRLRPMTNTKPKCLVTSAGKPILQYQIDGYIKAGIEELVIVVGYESDAIRNFCKHIKGVNIHIVDNHDYETTNNMYSLYLVREYVKDQGFILNNADLTIDNTIIETLAGCDAPDAIAVDRSLYNEESMKLSVDDGGRVIDISKEVPEQQSYGCSIDFYKFSPQASVTFFDEISRIIEAEKNLKDWTEVAMQRLMHNGAIDFQPCDISGKSWVEIDNYEDLALSDRVFSGFDAALEEIDTILLDLDGTVYVGSEMLPGAVDAINELKARGKKVYYLSNNSSKNKDDYVERLSAEGLALSTDDIVLSTDGLVSYLKQNSVESVHVLGTNSLKKILMDNGFRIDADKPEYVVLGYDTELSYPKLVTACRHINDGVDILATHADRFCPSEVGPIPDIGATIELLAATTGKTPVKIFGKPDLEMVRPLLTRHGIDAASTLIVGDRLHTDIRMAALSGCRGLLVLTGETSRDQLETADTQPHFVLDDITQMALPH